MRHRAPVISLVDELAFRFMISGVLAAISLLPLAGIFLVSYALLRRLRSVESVVLAIAMLGVYAVSPLPRVGAMAAIVAVPESRFPLVRLDLAMSRTAREEMVELATAGKLEPGEYRGEYLLPAPAAGLSVHGEVDVIDEPCGKTVFFMTLTGFSPDPYGGFEFVPPGCAPVSDPLGSGQGEAHPMGGSWYWIEAS